jgi:ribonuclease VapC
MIVIDTSAIIAILRQEPGFESLLGCIGEAESLSMSAVSFFEGQMVSTRSSDPNFDDRDFRQFIAQVDVEIIPFDAAQSALAFEAFSRFGKGSGHKARLNFGDCAAYALAKTKGAKLLFTGDDFSSTDITPAVTP